LDGTFTSFFKDKTSKRSHKTVVIKVFPTILLDDRRIRIRDPYLWLLDPDPDPGGPKTYGSGSDSHHTGLFHLPENCEIFVVDLLLLDALSQHLLSLLHHGQDPGLSLVRPARQEVTSLKNNSEHLLSFLHHGQDPGLSLVRPAKQEVTSLKATPKMGGNRSHSLLLNICCVHFMKTISWWQGFTTLRILYIW
jgi:hypothetical protein